MELGVSALKTLQSLDISTTLNQVIGALNDIWWACCSEENCRELIQLGALQSVVNAIRAPQFNGEAALATRQGAISEIHRSSLMCIGSLTLKQKTAVTIAFALNTQTDICRLILEHPEDNILLMWGCGSLANMFYANPNPQKYDVTNAVNAVNQVLSESNDIATLCSAVIAVRVLASSVIGMQIVFEAGSQNLVIQTISRLSASMSSIIPSVHSQQPPKSRSIKQEQVIPAILQSEIELTLNCINRKEEENAIPQQQQQHCNHPIIKPEKSSNSRSPKRFMICYTCYNPVPLIVCSECAKNCHSGHVLSEEMFDNCICNCNGPINFNPIIPNTSTAITPSSANTLPPPPSPSIATSI